MSIGRIEKIRVPAIKIVTASEDRTIQINDKIFGTIIVKLFNDDGSSFVEECEIRISGFCGEDFLVKVPKLWIGKKVIVKYEREVSAEKLTTLSEEWWHDFPYFEASGRITLDGLTFDYPDDDKVLYTIYFVDE